MGKCMICGAFINPFSVSNEYSPQYYADILCKYGAYTNVKPNATFHLCPDCRWNISYFDKWRPNFKKQTLEEYIEKGGDAVSDPVSVHTRIADALAKGKCHPNINGERLLEVLTKLYEDVTETAENFRQYCELRRVASEEFMAEFNRRKEVFFQKYPNRTIPSDSKYSHLSMVRTEDSLVFIEDCDPPLEKISKTPANRAALWYIKKTAFPALLEISDENLFSVTALPLDSIVSYQISGNLDRVSQTSGGGGGGGAPNIGGAIVGGLLFGTVGAIIGSQTGVTIDPIKSDVVEFDTRKTVLNLRNPDGSAEIRDLPLYYAELFKKLIPEKEFDFLRAEKNSASTPSPSPQKEAAGDDNNIEALKKFKELLDMGVITQQEFDAKKKQLLGL